MLVKAFFAILGLTIHAVVATVAVEGTQPQILEERNPLSALPGIILALLPEFFDLLFSEDNECNFVNKLKATVLADFRFSEMNVVIFSDGESSIAGLRGKECYEEDLQMAFGAYKKRYTVCVFEDGQFVRAGDGGCRNWGYGRCVKSASGQIVNFCRVQATSDTTRSTTPPAPAPAPATTTAKAPSPTTQVVISISTQPATLPAPLPTILSATDQASGGPSQPTATILSASRADAPKATQQVIAAVAAGIAAVYLV